MTNSHINAKELLRQFQVSERDLELIRHFGDNQRTDVKKFIDDFYAWMENQTWFDQFFSKGVPSSVQSLQREYWRSFLKADVNHEYINQRITVGRIHATINLPVTAYMAGMSFAYSWYADLAKDLVDDQRECIDLLSALSRLIQLDINIVMLVYSLQSMDVVRQQGEITSRIVKEATKVVKSAAKGNFNVSYQRQDENDTLEQPINRMITRLKKFSVETERDQWLKSGLAELALALRDGLDIESLTDNVIRFLAQYLNAQIGVFYVVKETGEAMLCSSFAFTRRKNLSTNIKPGEGLVGQALKERKPILISNVPDNYFSIKSGLGEHSPREIVVQPLLCEQKVHGLIELGSFHIFSEDQIVFLDQVSESIAVAIKSAQDQTTMRNLLEESQQTSGKLLHQKLELEEANHTLEEQAQALKLSKEELTLQKEMLENSNRELQLKTSDLERQKSAIETTCAELERKADLLVNSSKYKSEFLANMSHELRTPLNSLLLLSQSLIGNKEGNLTIDQVEDLEVIYSGGNTLLTLINDILDLSKIEAGKIQITLSDMNVHNLTSRLKKQFCIIAKQNDIDFEVDIEDGITELITDEQRVEQILRNLLSNALKFTHQGKVTLNIYKIKDSNFLPGQMNELESIAFSVSDTGIGIPDRDQQDIFGAFQQGDGSTSRSYGGTGLGLTISLELSKLLGGDIHFQSTEGKGSQFSFLLPYKRFNTEATGSSAGAHRSMLPIPVEDPIVVNQASKTKSLLIVEDDKSFCRILSNLASNHGFKTMVTNNCHDALDLVKTQAPSAIILDIGLPDKSGLSVLESIKSTNSTRDIPIHIISSKDRDDETLKKGAIGFLTKPASSDDIEKILSQFEALIRKDIKQLLIIEDDTSTREFLREYLSDKNIQITTTSTGGAAIQVLRQQRIDCCILDLGLNDMTGMEFLKSVEADKSLHLPPIIVYTSQNLSEVDYKQLRRYTDKIVLKEGSSPERLQEEVDMFLHSVDKHSSKSLLTQVPHPRPFEAFDGCKVLLVDDDLRNVYALSKVLKKQGLNVSIADNGKLALEKLKKNKDIDLVLMDIMMPVMDGYEAMTQIRKTISTSIPIIALTAKAMSSDKEKCLAAGANDYIAKPVDVNNLISMLKVWCYH